MMYFYDENFMLPLSHDEVVHGKSPMIYKMPGDEWQKFANLRLMYTYMFTHPGGNYYLWVTNLVKPPNGIIKLNWTGIYCNMNHTKNYRNVLKT